MSTTAQKILRDVNSFVDASRRARAAGAIAERDWGKLETTYRFGDGSKIILKGCWRYRGIIIE